MEPLKQKLTNAWNNIFILIQAHKRLLAIVILCIIVALGIILTSILLFKRLASNKITTSENPFSQLTDTNPNPSKNPKNTKSASLILQLIGPKKTFHIGDDIGFILIGDTSAQIIRGYDAIFQYDKNFVSFMSSKNLFPTFQYQLRSKANWVMVTSYQQLDTTKDIPFAKTRLAEFHFTALKAGIAYFPMSFIEGRLSDSNMIDPTANDILTSVNGLNISITQ